MSKAYDFVNECGVFFVSTINDDCPAVRPFGAVMEVDGELYISTSNQKEVYKQIKKNAHIQIIALKSGTRDWIRISGIAMETFDSVLKTAMLEKCPTLKNRFEVDSIEYVLFRIVDLSGELIVSNEVIKL